MTNPEEHWIKSPWTISIGTAILSLFLTIGYDYSKQRPILSTVWTILKWIATLIWNILNFDLKVWWVMLAIVIFILIILIITKFKNVETFKPHFYSYNEDKLKKWRWTWNWKFDSRKNSWIISDMKAHCPRCETPMINYSNRYELYFDCPRCEFSAKDGNCDEPHKVERIILDNIDRKEAEKKNSTQQR